MNGQFIPRARMSERTLGVCWAEIDGCIVTRCSTATPPRPHLQEMMTARLHRRSPATLREVGAARALRMLRRRTSAAITKLARRPPSSPLPTGGTAENQRGTRAGGRGDASDWQLPLSAGVPEAEPTSLTGVTTGGDDRKR